jgi:putative DNA primase/helicase
MLVERAKGQWAAIFEALAPSLLGPAMDNAPFHVPCPVHGGDNGYRLFEHFNTTGRCVCNTCGPKRDGFETLAWVKGYGYQDAVRAVAQWVRDEKAAPPRPPRPPVPMMPKVDPVVAYKRMCEIWRASTEIAGTAAEKYLTQRGIWPQNIPRTLRAHPGLAYYDVQTKTFLGTFPCLLAPIKNRDGTLCSLHRIFLTPEGLKAPVPSPKKMLSPCSDIRGAAIKMLEPGEVLGVSEGIETGLAAHAISRMPVWPCITAGLMEVVEIPDSVRHVVIWADLDRSNRGIDAADALADRMEHAGKTVEICIPQGPIPSDKKGVDWLEVLQTKGIGGFPAKWRKWRPDSPLVIRA